MPTTTFSQEVLRALALGSFPPTEDQRRKSVSVLRAALRCRRKRGLSEAQMELIGNANPEGCNQYTGKECAGKSMGTEGDYSKLKNPIAYQQTPYLKVPGRSNIVEKAIREMQLQKHGMGEQGEWPIQSLNPAELKSSQDWVVSDSMANIDKHTNAKNPILVIRYKGGLHVEDGNHRAAHALLNERTVSARILRLEDDGSVVYEKNPTANAETFIRVSKLAPYLHDLLSDVTKKQSRVIAQAIKRGIERKWQDSTVARTIAKFADIEPDRAKVIARTEMARAKSDLQLGKKRDSAKVRFVLGNEDACPICQALDGKVFTVRKAQGVVPVHPNCYCYWSDAEKGARVTRNELAPTVNDFRDSLLRFSTLNAFCATGEGGGVDPSCSPDEEGDEPPMSNDDIKSMFTTGGCGILAQELLEELPDAEPVLWKDKEGYPHARGGSL